LHSSLEVGKFVDGGGKLSEVLATAFVEATIFRLPINGELLQAFPLLEELL